MVFICVSDYHRDKDNLQLVFPALVVGLYNKEVGGYVVNDHAECDNTVALLFYTNYPLVAVLPLWIP
jgi:hypothetical protein